MGKSIWTLVQVIFFGCFLGGIICANLYLKDQTAWIGFLNDSNLAALQQQNAERDWYLYEVLFTRLVPFFFLLLFGFTKPGLVAAEVYAGWKGFSFGVLIASFIQRYGAKGMLVSLGMVVPQYLFYVVAYVMLFGWILRFHKNVLQEKIVLYAGIMFAALMAGMLLECYVNPTILRLVTRIL